MSQYQAPGVYVEEVERGPKPIEGVSTSVAGFLGETERGPTDPQLLTSFADYKRVFGGFVENRNLAYAVDGFFRNGGGRCYVGRVTAETEVGDANLKAGPGGYGPKPSGKSILRTPSLVDFGPVAKGDSVTKTVTLKNVGDGSDIKVKAGDVKVTGTDDGDFSAAPQWSNETTVEDSKTVKIDVTYTASKEDVERTATLSVPHDGDDAPTTVSLEAGTGVMDVEAVGPGDWAEHVVVLVDDATLYEPGQNELFKLTIRYWSDESDLSKAKTYHGDTEKDAVPAPDVEEVYDNLSPEKASSNYYETKVNGASNLVTLTRTGDGRPANSGSAPTWLGGSFSDPAVQASDFEGDATEPPNERTGLAAFDQIDEISICCIPDEHSYNLPEYTLTRKLKDHCENRGDRFAILQSKQNAARPGDLTRPVDSSYAAFYYPWLKVLDPETSVPTTVPPGGHIAGIYARSDQEHGVHKAPANEIVRGVQELQLNVTKGDQATLNPKGVNCIRSFRGRGIRVWGARTTSSDPSWKYVNVRRLFLFLEESIDEGTQWVVFESNDADTWARVTQTIENFLTGVWDDGALMGATPEQAFYVKCDRSTMTQDDIDNGRLICEIGVAPVKPAEFVIFRIAQWTGGGE